MPLIRIPQSIALTVAGSDPSGGAGIQADLKTFTMIGVYGGAAVSCLTAQNTKGVFAVQAVAPELVKQQIDAVLDDLEVSHIKIGMLGTGPVVESVCEALAGFDGEIILDPVQLSSSGHPLIDPDGLAAVKEQLLNICTVMTPNIVELSSMTGLNCSGHESFFDAAVNLLDRYEKLRAVIITGGHQEPAGNTVTDYLVSRSLNLGSADCLEVSHQRIKSSNTHGTGCTFAAAFTAYHLLTGDDSRAFRKAAGYMNDLIKKSAHFKLGHGNGPLVHYLR